MKLKEVDSEFCVIGEPLPISSQALAQLIAATMDKKASLRFKVKGFSMCPFVKDEDVATVSPLNNFAIGLGRVVAFIHPQTDKIIVHRVVGNRNNAYFIKGDNVGCVDGLVPRKNILGYVTKIERKNKNYTLGLGPERRVIAFLSRYFSFFVLLCFVHRIMRSAKRRIWG